MIEIQSLNLLKELAQAQKQTVEELRKLNQNLNILNDRVNQFGISNATGEVLGKLTEFFKPKK